MIAISAKKVSNKRKYVYVSGTTNLNEDFKSLPIIATSISWTISNLLVSKSLHNQSQESFPTSRVYFLPSNDNLWGSVDIGCF